MADGGPLRLREPGVQSAMRKAGREQVIPDAFHVPGMPRADVLPMEPLCEDEVDRDHGELADVAECDAVDDVLRLVAAPGSDRGEPRSPGGVRTRDVRSGPNSDAHRAAYLLA